jgi:YbbR domain-containing protein
LQISDIITDPIKVLISGPASILNQLTTENVSIELDLSNYKSSGTYTLDINKDAIKTPENTTYVRYNPSAITVKIDNK